MEIQENTTLLKRPVELECDVVRFQNQKDKLNGLPSWD